jgi:D-amino-acid dehydrogenase
VTLASGKFYATPMETGLRIAGTVEIAGVDAEPNFERARALLEHGRNLYPGLKTDGAIEWSGCRPSLPDSLPVIGRSPRHDNVYYAFGHGHLGLTEGGFTGKLIAEQIAGKPTSIDLTPYRADRF